MAADYEAGAAMREALFGNAAEARQQAAAALRLSTGRYVQCNVALVLALAGDVARAQALADDLAKRFSQDTEVRFYCLPTIQAQLALSRKDAPRTIELLQAAAPYELGEGAVQLYHSCREKHAKDGARWIQGPSATFPN